MGIKEMWKRVREGRRGGEGEVKGRIIGGDKEKKKCEYQEKQGMLGNLESR